MSLVRRSRVAHVTLAVALGLLGSALWGCTGGDDSSTSSAAPPTDTTSPDPGSTEPGSDGTELSDLVTTDLVVNRTSFCDRIDPAAAEAALGEGPVDAVAYRSGQRIRVTDDLADVVHEFGCRWTAGDSTAEAWVFAPPVTVARARKLAADVRAGRGCESGVAPAFGSPTAACAGRSGGRSSMSYSGLFGDAWLSCSLSLAGASDTSVAERASAWCAAVATGAAAG